VTGRYATMVLGQTAPAPDALVAVAS